MIASSEAESVTVYDRYVASNEHASPNLVTISSSIKEPKFPGALVLFDEETLFAAAPDHVSWRALMPLLEARIAYQLSDLPQPQGTGDPPGELITLLHGY